MTATPQPRPEAAEPDPKRSRGEPEPARVAAAATLPTPQPILEVTEPVRTQGAHAFCNKVTALVESNSQRTVGQLGEVAGEDAERGCGADDSFGRPYEDIGPQVQGTALVGAALPEGFGDRKVNVTPAQALAVLAEGNARYSRGRGRVKVDGESAGDENTQGSLAVVLACSDERLHVESIFDVDAGQILVARTCGNVCGAQAEDSVLGSIELMMLCRAPPLILVMGHTDCTELNAAVEQVMTAQEKTTEAVPDNEDALVSQIVPAVEDAVRSHPRASKSDIVFAATELNIWIAIERLLQNSSLTQELISSGKVQVHGAVYDVVSKQVDFLGQHPSLSKFGGQGASKSHLVRSISLPPDEALASLAAGNARYLKGLRGARLSTSDLREALVREGQKPTATIIGCADSRVPIEILFDAQPGDLFVLRNAGNTCTHAEGSLVGSVEYSVGHLGTSLVIVLGHTSCGAIVGATKTLLEIRATRQEQVTRSNLQKLLRGLTTVVEKAEKELQDLGREQNFENLAAQAVRSNIFHTMHKLLEYSAELRNQVRLGKVQVHGALYDLTTGKVEFLGQHPGQHEVLGQEGEPYDWMKPEVSYFPRPALLHRNGQWALPKEVHCRGDAVDVVRRLTEGNRRAMAFTGRANSAARAPPTPDMREGVSTAAGLRRPIAIVISSLVMPVERVFDAQVGELISIRTSYQIIGPAHGVVMASIEHAIRSRCVPFVLVLGTSRAALIDDALNMVTGNAAPAAHGATPWMQVVSALMPAALSAVRQCERDGRGSSKAGHWAEVQALASEMAIYNSVQRLLEQSGAIREAVKRGKLEVHGATFDPRTTRVTFLGPHPRQHKILARDARFE